jgi:hypothetical protein
LILTTSQSPDFDITKDIVDLSKSPNLIKINPLDDIFEVSYKWLFNKLNHDKWIWCYKECDIRHKNHGSEHVLWTLDVPESECILINESVWEHVINRWAYKKEWDNYNVVINDEEFDQFKKMYKGKEESTWNDIFNPTEHSGVQILVKSPVLDKYVLKKEWCCDYNLDVFDTEIINMGFCTLNNLEYYKEVYESGLKGRKIPFMSEIISYENHFGLKIEWNEYK